MVSEQYPESDRDLQSVQEALDEYVRSIDTSLPQGGQGHAFTLPEFFENKLLIVEAIRHGMPYGFFERIREIAPFTEDDWADYLNISRKTLQRNSWDPGFLFKPIHTEKIIELTEVTVLGREIFGAFDTFYTWLNAPCLALGGRKPVELLRDSYGKELVVAELNRIDQGIFA